MTDTNCQRASQSLYETIAVSLFARLPPRALLAASPLARDSCSATFSPRIFEQKRDCSQSNRKDPGDDLCCPVNNLASHLYSFSSMVHPMRLSDFCWGISLLGVKRRVTMIP